MSTKRVVLIGWNPEVVDYSKWPGLTPERLKASLIADRDKLNGFGYQTSLLFIDSEDTAYATVKAALSNENYDCILIGAGVRTIPEHFLVFEQLVNAAHEAAPDARICFNTNPTDTAEAVKRWL